MNEESDVRAQGLCAKQEENGRLGDQATQKVKGEGNVVEREEGQAGNEAGKQVDNGEERGSSIFSWDEGARVEPWPEPVNGAELLEELAGLVRRYVVMGRHAPETIALWVVHTYGFQLRDVTTYIGIESPQKRCGKTTLLTVLNEVVNRPVVASNISSPAFFRVIEEKQPTLMIDEADTVLHRNDELRGILNAGYRRKTAYVVRVAHEKKKKIRKAESGNVVGKAKSGNVGMEMGKGEMTETVIADRRGYDGTRLVRFSCWCPKAIATIKHLPETLADRCIIITMQRKKVSEKCERVKDADGSEVRRKCERFVRDHAQEIGKACPEIPAELNDRAAEIWEPLFAVADLAGGEWPKRAREAAVGLSTGGQEETAVGALLFDISTGFLELETERMFSRDVVAWLNGRGERPWAEIRKGRALSEAWLSRQLHQYGVSAKPLWIGERSARGYELKDFREAFERYIPKGQAKKMIEELKAGPGG